MLGGGVTHTAAAIYFGGGIGQYLYAKWQRFVDAFRQSAKQAAAGELGVGWAGERYASLSASGDIQLAIMPRAKGNKGKQGEAMRSMGMQKFSD